MPSPSKRPRTADALGEFALIERLARFVPAAGPGMILGIGDDAAVWRGTGRVVATCDVQIEGVHFSWDVSSPADVGWRALAVNLSDVAAMGGTPRYALVSLAVPADTAVAVLDGVYRGLGAAARAYRVAVVGGNVSRTEGPLVVDVTLIGGARRVLTRRGARPGDGVWITGAAGGAAAGLFLARHPKVRVAGSAALKSAYRRPLPRLRAGRLLAARRAVTAMLDTSDGTASDLLHLAEASRVGVRIEATRVPTPAGLTETARAARCDPAAWVLGGGEDYELLFTARPSFGAAAAQTARRAGVAMTRIGEIMPLGQGRWVIGADGGRTPLVATGWDHFGRRSVVGPARR